ncbi:MAG: hypothetical protein MP439_11075 [Ferrimicrobium sp.]|nr:hypothetical protein [Ferrimicrobium sp.]
MIAPQAACGTSSMIKAKYTTTGWCVATQHGRSWLGVTIITLACLVLASCGTIQSSQGPAQSSQESVLHVSEGASHAITTPFEGTNLDYSGVAEPYGVASVIDAVTSAAPGTIRYPGGAISNYWDWQTGTVNQPPSTSVTNSGRTKTKPGRYRRYGFTLTTLKKITHATGAVPIFDLNVMTSTLSDQLEMLTTAAQMGIPVRYIELGNEFYLPDSNYLRAFPTPRSYADLVASWAPAIRAAFPNAQIAAVASAERTTPRERQWNSILLSIAARDINAVTLHDYPSIQATKTRLPAPATLLAGASIDWQPVADIINSLPSRLSVWITEYNLGINALSLGSPAFGTTWEHALYIAELDLQELASPRITLTDYWDLFGAASSAQFTSGIPPTTTPTGSASRLINQAMKQATEVTELTIANDPVLNGSTTSVSGINVRPASGGDRLIFVNLGSSSATLAAGKLIPTGASAQQLRGSPLAQAVNLVSLHVSSDLTLPPYSVTVVSK